MNIAASTHPNIQSILLLNITYRTIRNMKLDMPRPMSQASEGDLVEKLALHRNLNVSSRILANHPTQETTLLEAI